MWTVINMKHGNMLSVGVLLVCSILFIQKSSAETDLQNKDNCPQVMCATLSCKNGFQVDNNGCRLCACNLPSCPQVRCRDPCPNGYKLNENGCQTCAYSTTTTIASNLTTTTTTTEDATLEFNTITREHLGATATTISPSATTPEQKTTTTDISPTTTDLNNETTTSLPEQETLVSEINTELPKETTKPVVGESTTKTTPTTTEYTTEATTKTTQDVVDTTTLSQNEIPESETEKVSATERMDQTTTIQQSETTTLKVEETTITLIPNAVNLKEKSKNATVEPKGRALNFTSHLFTNAVQNNSASKEDLTDLSDVTIHEDSMEGLDGIDSKILAPKHVNMSAGVTFCEQGGLTYEEGEKIESGCDQICTCMRGKMECGDRCTGPLLKKGKKIEDPLCVVKDSDDPCCSVLDCPTDNVTETSEMCKFNNTSYKKDETFHKNCEETCTCETGGNLNCKPRCKPIESMVEGCVEIPDPQDFCCKTVLCDVTLHDNEPEKDEDFSKYEIKSAKYVNTSTIYVLFEPMLYENESTPIVEISLDQKVWKAFKLFPGGYLPVENMENRFIKMEGNDNLIKIEGGSSANETTLTPISSTEETTTQKTTGMDNTCTYKSKTFKIGEEYNDNCTSLCVCKENGMQCLKLECPTFFGVDVVDPLCVEWDTVPPKFTPSPPLCCPEKLVCKNNGSCLHEGELYNNWQPIPSNVSGCENRCYCEMGKVECQNACPPVTALPPANLPCPPQLAMVGHIPDDDCCMYWVCKTGMPGHQEATTTSYDKTKTFVPTQLPKLKDNDQTRLLPTVPPKMRQKENDIMRQNFASQGPPSKMLGPLQIYQNHDDNSVLPYTISSNENHYSHLANSLPPTEIKNPQTTMFVTPRPLPNAPNPKDETPYIQIHAKGSPEEILHFIQQHPELSNYPTGSVLELQNGAVVPVTISNPRPNEEQNYLIPNPANGHIPIPLAPHQFEVHGGHNLPPGINLEHILNEIHKNPSLSPYFDQTTGHTLQGPPLFNVVTPNHTGPIFNGGFPNDHYPQPQDEIHIQDLGAIDSHTVRLVFMVPSLIVGLHGRVEVRYTYLDNDDEDTWELQVFAPPNDLIATSQLEFDLVGLKSDAEYKIKIAITLRDLNNSPQSRVYRVKTPKETTTTTLPPMIPIKPELEITDVNATWCTVTWRKFSEYELQFIDGVQLRFKELDGKIYAATPLIHRAVTTYTLENLKANTKYELGIFFIPFPGQTTELHAEHMLHFTTANEVDTYGFNVTLDISQIKSTSVEISWNGVPYPEDKYVNIYRAIYQSDSGKEDQSTFKIAKRDSATKTIIVDLKPGTRYRLWLEVYLTNGKIKTSNVQDFVTKPRPAPALGASTQQGKLAIGEQVETHRGDYYGPLVIVAILAAIAILSTLILLLILVRRHNQNKAAITTPTRISQSAYDNPTYKVEIQQETMGM